MPFTYVYCQFGSGSNLYNLKPLKDIITEFGSKENPKFDSTGHVIYWKEGSQIVVSFSVGVTLSMQWSEP